MRQNNQVSVSCYSSGIHMSRDNCQVSSVALVPIETARWTRMTWHLHSIIKWLRACAPRCHRTRGGVSMSYQHAHTLRRAMHASNTNCTIHALGRPLHYPMATHRVPPSLGASRVIEHVTTGDRSHENPRQEIGQVESERSRDREAMDWRNERASLWSPRESSPLQAAVESSGHWSV